MTFSHRVVSTWCLFALVCVSSGCAQNAAPYFSGARTTPNARADVFVGSAFRAPVGGLRRNAQSNPDAETLLTLMGREGVVPVEALRYGFGDNADLGLTVASTSVAFNARYAVSLGESTRVIFGLSPGLGLLRGQDARGNAYGITMPITFTMDLGGIYELWAGARVGLDRASGSVGDVDTLAMTGLRIGGVAGLAIGFRTIAALIELAVDYETWTGSVDTTGFGGNGLVLTPAFAIRVRL